MSHNVFAKFKGIKIRDFVSECFYGLENMDDYNLDWDCCTGCGDFSWPDVGCFKMGEGYNFGFGEAGDYWGDALSNNANVFYMEK